MTSSAALRIAIVDGEHARFVQPDADNEPRTIGSLDSASAHLRSRDIGSDKPGRSFKSAASAHHAVGEHHDLHAMEKERFVALVGEQLSAASRCDEFARLLLVAPSRVLHELRDALDAATQVKLIGMLEEDLMKTPDHDLSSYLHAWVGPVHRRGA